MHTLVKIDSSLEKISAALLDVPVQTLISTIRLVLSLCICIIIASGFHELDHRAFFVFILITYFLLSFSILAGIFFVGKFSRLSQYIIHIIDIAVTIAIMFLHQDVTSFVFFQFTLTSATLRWNLQGALGTAGILTISLWALYWLGISPDPNTISTGPNEFVGTLFRGGFLLTGGIMLAYLGAYRDRSHRRFAKLASWPAVHNASSHLELLDILLRYSADIVQAPRVLLVWDEKDEPGRHLALWTREGLQCTEERPGLFGTIVAPGYEARPIVYPPTTSSGFPATNSRQYSFLIDRDLVQTFGIKSAVSAPFSTARCRGRIFVLDSSAREDDLLLVSVIAARIGTSLEARILRRQLEFAAAMGERTKLSRDLHDGVLQGLAAANMQLKVLSIALPSGLQEQLHTVRNTLTDEAQRIRNFVEANRATAPSSTGIAPIALEAEKRVARLRDLWECEIALSVDPPDLATSVTTMRNVGHMIAEGVSNAVRHGCASRVTIAVVKRDDRLVLDISDNGQGFKDLAGSYTAGELASMNTGPLSLRSRAEECGGTLYLTCSPAGTHLTVELPI
jgi:signal transduction histidine kinase